MKAYITAYALTEGIVEIEAEECGDETIRQTDLPRGCWYFHGEGREWHRTREGAIEKAGIMRARKIASLEKQLVKLRATKF